MKELRIAEIRADVSAEADALVIVGTPIVFDTPTTINDPAGSFTEVIQRGALDGADLSDVRLLYNHDTNKVPLARTPKTMSLSVTDTGLSMVAHLPNTEEARSVYTSVQRGDLSGMSFAFTVDEGGDSYETIQDGKGYSVRRIIRKIRKLYECSIVPFPAYAQTSVEARSSLETQGRLNVEKLRARCLINSILMKRI